MGMILLQSETGSSVCREMRMYERDDDTQVLAKVKGPFKTWKRHLVFASGQKQSLSWLRLMSLG